MTYVYTLYVKEWKDGKKARLNSYHDVCRGNNNIISIIIITI